MKWAVTVYFDNMPDGTQIFEDKDLAINELHRLNLKYRNSRLYKVEMTEVGNE